MTGARKAGVEGGRCCADSPQPEGIGGRALAPSSPGTRLDYCGHCGYNLGYSVRLSRCSYYLDAAAAAVVGRDDGPTDCYCHRAYG